MNILDFIKSLQDATTGNITVNINVASVDDDDVYDISDVFDDTLPEPEAPDTDFDIDDKVLVCHIRKDGERVHTVGRIIEVLGHDDKGWYTRVLGANGKHYRAGLKFNEERLGTIIYTLE